MAVVYTNCTEHSFIGGIAFELNTLTHLKLKMYLMIQLLMHPDINKYIIICLVLPSQVNMTLAPCTHHTPLPEIYHVDALTQHCSLLNNWSV